MTPIEPPFLVLLIQNSGAVNVASAVQARDVHVRTGWASNREIADCGSTSADTTPGLRRRQRGKRSEDDYVDFKARFDERAEVAACTGPQVGTPKLRDVVCHGQGTGHKLI